MASAIPGVRTTRITPVPSLRIPAAFCGVCGLRPRPGLVPEYDDLQVTGPMHFSFSSFNIVVMRVGQLEVIE